MNRNDEFLAIIAELNQPVTGLEYTLNRAFKKKRERTAKLIGCPLGGLAACFVFFVLLVNLSMSVANACAQVPVLRQLAEAVTFSRSLSTAVENEYVQIIDLEQTQNDISAKIEYLIVDQKQVNIFYRLNSDKYDQLTANPAIGCDDDNVAYYVYNSSFGKENGELLSVTVDFTQGNVPEKLQCTLNIYSFYTHLTQGASTDGPQYLAEMKFDLVFDPQFTATGKVLPVNETVILDGQNITVTNVEVYPTHLRVEISESSDNTAWLKNLDFYIETDDGSRFDPVTNGVSATGSGDSASMISYRADSTYFYEAEHLKLVITGAKWLRKDIEPTYLNLVTKEHSELPEGAELYYVQKQGDNWTVQFHVTPGEDGEMPRLFGDVIYDSAGNSYTINKHNFIISRINKDGSIQYYHEFVTLENYPDDEVWLAPPYSSVWAADEPIEITVR